MGERVREMERRDTKKGTIMQMKNKRGVQKAAQYANYFHCHCCWLNV